MFRDSIPIFDTRCGNRVDTISDGVAFSDNKTAKVCIPSIDRMNISCMLEVIVKTGRGYFFKSVINKQTILHCDKITEFKNFEVGVERISFRSKV